VLKNFAIVWTILILLGAMAGLYDSGQQLQRPMSEAEKFGSGLGIIAGLGLWGALWFFPVLGALVLGLLLKKSSIVERGPG
jgi:H+/Cl- antiporter ClcA